MELFEYLTEVHNCRGLSSKTQEITAVPSIELGLLPPALSGQPADGKGGSGTCAHYNVCSLN